MKLEIYRVQDGSLTLNCGDTAMRDDLVFASGAMFTADKDFTIQLNILLEIVSKVNNCTVEEAKKYYYSDYSEYE